MVVSRWAAGVCCANGIPDAHTRSTPVSTSPAAGRSASSSLQTAPGTTAPAAANVGAGALAWNELTTRDVDGSKEFYPAVFGWAVRDVSFEDASYTLWEVDGQPVAGMMPMVGEQWPPDLPPHWMVYFAVDDTDAAAGRVTELGGQVSVPPADTPAGRLAVVGDPHGAFFSIIRPDPAFRP